MNFIISHVVTEFFDVFFLGHLYCARTINTLAYVVYEQKYIDGLEILFEQKVYVLY